MCLDEELRAFYCDEGSPSAGLCLIYGYWPVLGIMVFVNMCACIFSFYHFRLWGRWLMWLWEEDPTAQSLQDLFSHWWHVHTYSLFICCHLCTIKVTYHVMYKYTHHQCTINVYVPFTVLSQVWYFSIRNFCDIPFQYALVLSNVKIVFS